jgi:sodium transport system ATP-binding protein
MSLEVLELTKDFQKFRAVDRVSFTAYPGEVLGLLGENGAGKTTTMRMLATILKPTSGTARIGNLDLIRDNSKIRAKLGVLFDGGLYDRLTARENVAYFGQLHGMSEQEIRRRIDFLFPLLEMTEFADRRCGDFSKGMKQKVAIARAVIHDPEVLLFDEPTAGLDVTATRAVHEFLSQVKKMGKTVIFSSHIMSEVEKVCDRIVIIHKGKIVENDTVAGLKARYQQELEDVFVRLVGGSV